MLGAVLIFERISLMMSAEQGLGLLSQYVPIKSLLNPTSTFSTHSIALRGSCEQIRKDSRQLFWLATVNYKTSLIGLHRFGCPSGLPRDDWATTSLGLEQNHAKTLDISIDLSIG
jgi:hypothetical protein